MEDYNHRILNLLELFESGLATVQELEELDNWYNSFQINERYTDGLSDVQELLVKENLFANIQSQLSRPAVSRKRYVTKRLWSRIAAAAAVVAAITLSTWLYTSRHSDAGQDPGSAQYSKDIAPGKNTATLTLANGKTITLSDAKTGVVIDASKLTYNDGTSILSSTVDTTLSTFLTASTPRGGTYQVILPDGTKVWLNAASTLKFPSTFAGLTQRKVILSGEAYFEVDKDKLHPFIVETNNQEVEVLGTHFNINAYANEPNTKTTLLEGSVKVSSSLNQSSSSSKILSPGFEAINSGTAIAIKKVDTDLAIAWKNGLFMFDEETLESILLKVARWYNVEVIYEDEEAGKQLFSGSVSRFSKVSSVLSKLEKTGPVKFELEGRKLTVRTKK